MVRETSFCEKLIKKILPKWYLKSWNNNFKENFHVHMLSDRVRNQTEEVSLGKKRRSCSCLFCPESYPISYSCDVIYVWCFCDYCISGMIYFNIYNIFLKSSICFSTLLLRSLASSLCTNSNELLKLSVIFPLLIPIFCIWQCQIFLSCLKNSSTSLNLSEPQLLPL